MRGSENSLSPFQLLVDRIATFGKVRWLGWETDQQMAEAGTKLSSVIRTNGNEVARILAPLAQKMYLNRHSIDLLEGEHAGPVSNRIEVIKDWQYPHIFYLEMKHQDADQHPHAKRLVFNLKPDKTLIFKGVEYHSAGDTTSVKELPAGWYDSRGKQALPSVNQALADVRRLEPKINELVAALV